MESENLGQAGNLNLALTPCPLALHLIGAAWSTAPCL